MNLTLAVVGLLFLCLWMIIWFCAGTWLYRRGLNDGLSINHGASNIEPITTPLKYIEQRKEFKATKAETDKIVEGMTNIFSYEGKAQGGETT